MLLRPSLRSDQLYRLSTRLDPILTVKPLSAGTCGRSNCTHERCDYGCESSAGLAKQSHLLKRYQNSKIRENRLIWDCKQAIRLYRICDGGDKQGHLSYADNCRLRLNRFLKISTVQWKIVCLSWHWQQSKRKISRIVSSSYNKYLPEPLRS